MDHAPAAPDPWCTFAQIDVAGMRVAIATEHIRQAVPRPQQVARLPRSHSALDGVFQLRGQAVPIVDLRPWLQQPTPAPLPHIMVLAAASKVVGLAVEAIHGLVRLRASRVRAIHRDADADGFFHSVLSVSDDSELIGVLDPDRLITQARAWADGGTAATAHGAAGVHLASPAASVQAHTTTQALVRLGPLVLGVDAAVVREVLPMPPLQRVFGRGTPFQGMVRWRGTDVPVIDPTKGLQVPHTPELGAQRLLMVMERENRWLALPVDGVMAVRGIDLAQVQPAAEAGLPSCFVGTTQEPGGQRIWLLDCLAVLQAHGFAPTSHAVAGLVNPAQALHTASGTGQPHLVFDMGSEWAAPMDTLHEITPLPAHFQPGRGHDPAHIGVVEWRGKSVPVLDLRPPGRAPIGPGTQLLVVHAHGRVAALAVNSVVAMLPAHLCVHTHLTLPGGGPMHLITVGQPPARKSHRVLEVGALPFFCAPEAPTRLKP